MHLFSYQRLFHIYFSYILLVQFCFQVMEKKLSVYLLNSLKQLVQPWYYLFIKVWYNCPIKPFDHMFFVSILFCLCLSLLSYNWLFLFFPQICTFNLVLNFFCSKIIHNVILWFFKISPESLIAASVFFLNNIYLYLLSFFWISLDGYIYIIRLFKYWLISFIILF